LKRKGKREKREKKAANDQDINGERDIASNPIHPSIL
jgi:hypothetical protein